MLFLVSCRDGEDNDLPSVEERVTAAISELRTNLVAPEFGWKLEYQPTDESGIFFVLLDFDDVGTVSIKSDVADNAGEFYDHTISWRIDNAMGLELIFETYGVFHYLFEQDAATFGAEFEFVYQGKQGENLVFRSASDVTSIPSVLFFEPAASGDAALFARDIAEGLNAFATLSPQALQAPVPKQQIILESSNISILWSLDPAKRIVTSIMAGTGTDFYQPSFNGVLLDHSSGYKLQDGKLILLEPLQFTLGFSGFTVDEITFTDFSNTGAGFCSSSPGGSPVFEGEISGNEPISMQPSLFDPEGTEFVPFPDYPYSVNSVFIFDESGASLSDPGNILAEKFPEAVAFLFYYGYVPGADSLPSYAAGFVLDHGDGTNDFYLREFMPVTTVGNRITIQLTDNYFYTGTPAPGEQASLEEITDLIFEGGSLYASDFPVEGLTVFNLFNPCNRHEIFLVK
jgi:hypothetical protein